MNSRRGLTLLEVICIVLMIAIAAGLILPVFARTRSSSCGPRCSSNLNQIAKAMFMYADVPSNGTFPCAGNVKETADPLLSLGLLYNKYVADPKVFSCPSHPVAPALLQAIVPGGPVVTSYGYDPGHSPDDAIAAILADCKGAGLNSDNHGPNAGQNVVIGAGTVEFLESSRRMLPDMKDGKQRIDNIFERDLELERNIDGVIRQSPQKENAIAIDGVGQCVLIGAGTIEFRGK